MSERNLNSILRCPRKGEVSYPSVSVLREGGIDWNGVREVGLEGLDDHRGLQECIKSCPANIENVSYLGEGMESVVFSCKMSGVMKAIRVYKSILYLTELIDLKFMGMGLNHVLVPESVFHSDSCTPPLRLQEIFNSGRGKKRALDRSQTQICLSKYVFVMERMDVLEGHPMDLIHLILLLNKTGNTLSLERVFTFSCQMVTGIGELHERGWEHRDVKAENMGLFNMKIKLFDLGMLTQKRAVGSRKGYKGTRGYLPTREDYERDTFCLDSFACIMTIYLLVTHSKFHMKIGNLNTEGGKEIQFEKTPSGREFFMRPTPDQVEARKEHFKLCLDLLPDENDDPDSRSDVDQKRLHCLSSVIELLNVTASGFSDISLDVLRNNLSFVT